MNANGTTTATDGASFGRRRLDVLLGFALCIAFVACSRGSGTQAGNEPSQALDATLLRAVGKAVQPCIRAHRAPTASSYTAQLRLERRPAGTAAATFLDGRTAGHEAFESCALKAIDGAAIIISQSTTMPVMFDFGPER